MLQSVFRQLQSQQSHERATRTASGKSDGKSSIHTFDGDIEIVDCNLDEIGSAHKSSSSSSWLDGKNSVVMQSHHQHLLAPYKESQRIHKATAFCVWNLILATNAIKDCQPLSLSRYGAATNVASSAVNRSRSDMWKLQVCKSQIQSAFIEDMQLKSVNFSPIDSDGKLISETSEKKFQRWAKASHEMTLTRRRFVLVASYENDFKLLSPHIEKKKAKTHKNFINFRTTFPCLPQPNRHPSWYDDDFVCIWKFLRQCRGFSSKLNFFLPVEIALNI